MKYQGNFGEVYEVSDGDLEEFERRRGNLLKLAIVVKVVILAGILYLRWVDV